MSDLVVNRKCVAEENYGDCDCIDCAEYSYAFDAVFDMATPDHRSSFVSAILNNSDCTKELAEKNADILEDTGVISYMNNEGSELKARGESLNKPTPPPNRVYKETLFGGLVEIK